MCIQDYTFPYKYYFTFIKQVLNMWYFLLSLSSSVFFLIYKLLKASFPKIWNLKLFFCYLYHDWSHSLYNMNSLLFVVNILQSYI